MQSNNNTAEKKSMGDNRDSKRERERQRETERKRCRTREKGVCDKS
jgi:hypothetical protein